MRRPVVADVNEIGWQTDVAVLHALEPSIKWEERFGRGKLKVLSFDPDSNAGSYIVYWPVEYDPFGCHKHGGNEELLILEGELKAGGRVYGPGTYMFTPAGQKHGPFVPGQDGCLYLILVDGPLLSEDFRGEMRSTLKAARHKRQV